MDKNNSPNSSNTSSIQLFEYEGAEVRTVLIDGEAWFVAKDVCDILGLSNAREAVSVLDDDEKNTVRISDGIQGRGNPNVNVISEPAVYKLVFRSQRVGPLHAHIQEQQAGGKGVFALGYS